MGYLPYQLVRDCSINSITQKNMFVSFASFVFGVLEFFLVVGSCVMVGGWDQPNEMIWPADMIQMMLNDYQNLAIIHAMNLSNLQSSQLLAVFLKV